MHQALATLGEVPPATSGLAPRLRILLAVVYLIVVSAVPASSWRSFGLFAVLLLSAAAVLPIDRRRFARRLFGFGLFTAILAAGIPLSRGLAGGWDVFAAVLARAVLSFGSVLLLLSTTRPEDLLAGLRGLGIPRMIVSLLALTYRYVAVFWGELVTMQRARACRSPRTSVCADWRMLPNLIGALFLRSVDRAERVHQAMLARGFRGEWPSLEAPRSEPSRR